MTRPTTTVAPLLLLAACAATTDTTGPYPVTEIGRSQHCAIPLGWERIAPEDPLPEEFAGRPRGDGALLLISMGPRRSGGYGIDVAPHAERRGEQVHLAVTFEHPAPDAMVTQALTSPCVLLSIAVPEETEIRVDITE